MWGRKAILGSYNMSSFDPKFQKWLTFYQRAVSCTGSYLFQFSVHTFNIHRPPELKS